MIYEKILEGKYVKLQYAQIEDAEEILSIRQDPKLTKYLPRLNITIEEQRAWLEQQQEREGDYYFCVWNKENKLIGTIRIYNIHDGIGETGSLALKGNAFENLEAKLLCEDFLWDILKLNSTIGIINVENIQAQKFAQLFGVEFEKPSHDERGFERVIGHNSKEKSVKYRDKIRKILYGRDRNER